MRLLQTLAVIIFVVILFAFGAMSISAAPSRQTGATPTPIGGTSKIAFVSHRDGNYQIYTMNPDGTEQTNISNNKFNDMQPAWSFDVKRLAFVSDRDGNNE